MRPEPATDAQVSDDGDMLEHERLAKLVSSLITMMNVGSMARLDVEYRDLRVSLRACGETVTSTRTAYRAVDADRVNAPDGGDSEVSSSHIVTAPMIGTYYASPAPSEPPFVSVGDRIEEGQTIGIIEAMKIMNEIAADRSGTVIEIIASNAQPVEFGSPLVRLDPAVS
jgi:acetyl-CoA carboxylase biotin carboxyl carrier protein